MTADFPKKIGMDGGHCCFYALFEPIRNVLASFYRLFGRKGKNIMTENEKELLQAKHRLEEAQARDRVKERKARTRRLIQEGAILEKAFPAASTMDLKKLEDYLIWALK